MVLKTCQERVTVNWKDKVCDLVIALIAVAVGGAIAFYVGWTIYLHSQRQQLDRMVLALRYETSKNISTLKSVITDETWGENKINTYYPVIDVASYALSEPYILTAEKPFALMSGIIVYKQNIEATQRMMDIMKIHFAEKGKLSKASLVNLDDTCRAALAVSYTLQILLKEYIAAHGLKSSSIDQFEEYKKILYEQSKIVEKEVRRPQKTE